MLKLSGVKMNQDFFNELKESFENKQKLNLFVYSSLGGDDHSVLYTRDEKRGLDNESEYTVIALHIKTKGFLAISSEKMETNDGAKRLNFARLHFHNLFPNNFKRIDFKDLILFYLED